MIEHITFASSRGNRVSAILSSPSNYPVPVAIYAHGFTSNKNTDTALRLEEALNSAGIALLRFDFFGHGESDGKFEDITLSEGTDDILSAIKYLKARDYERIGLIGSSFGGNCSILAAANSKDLFALALKCPVPDYITREDAIRSPEFLAEWRHNGVRDHYERGGKFAGRLKYSYYEDMQINDGYAAAAKINVPVLIVHGDKDALVPIELVRRLPSLINDCRFEVIEGADHHFSNKSDYDKMINLLAEFVINKSK